MAATANSVGLQSTKGQYSESGFLTRVSEQQSQFALLTGECMSQPTLFDSVRQCSPNVRLMSATTMSLAGSTVMPKVQNSPVVVEKASCTVKVKVGFMGLGGSVSATADTCPEAWRMVKALVSSR